jgi:hypothetical protein
MVELIVADSTDPSPAEIRGRFTVSAPADIERELRRPSEICYGTHYLLRGHGIDIAAVCVSERYLGPEEEGCFLLYRNGQLINGHATRNDVIENLIGALA